MDKYSYYLLMQDSISAILLMTMINLFRWISKTWFYLFEAHEVACLRNVEKERYF